MNDLNYLPPKELSFSLSENGILSLDWNGVRYDPVQLTRLFPFQDPEEYLSVSAIVGEEPKELGILLRLSDLAPEQQELLRGYLRYKYFIPRIEKIGKVEEKLGYVYMDVTTVLGQKTICISDVTSNIRLIRRDYISLIDVQGNRYYIDNLDSLDKSTRQKIELYI